MEYLEQLAHDYKYFTLAELAERYQKPCSTLYRDLIRAGGITYDLNPKLTIPMVQQAYEKGFSIRAMMGAFGCSYNDVLQKLTWAGLSISHSEGLRRRTRYEEQWASIREDLDRGMSKRWVAQTYHIRPSMVNQLIETHGYVYRRQYVRRKKMVCLDET